MLTNEKRLLESANTSAASLLALIAAAEFDGYFTIKEVEAALPPKCRETNAVYRVLQKGMIRNFIISKTRRELKDLSGNPAQVVYLMSDEARRYYRANRHITPEIRQFLDLDLTPKCWLIWKALTLKGRCSRRQLCIALYGNSDNLSSVIQILRRLKTAKLVKEGRIHPKRYFDALPLPRPTPEEPMPDFRGIRI